jgi:putative addiction module component (TIGR02574 family)
LNVIVGGFQVHPTRTSIFDLSPAEKLQLVEDLWDDLAATPDVVPVHDWQKEELARRKANLMQNPASGLTWEEVKQRVRRRYGR